VLDLAASGRAWHDAMLEKGYAMRALLIIAVLSLATPAFGQAGGDRGSSAEEKAAAKKDALAKAKRKCLMYPSTCKAKPKR
jgi:hypothetical protein